MLEEQINTSQLPGKHILKITCDYWFYTNNYLNPTLILGNYRAVQGMLAGKPYHIEIAIMSAMSYL